MEGKILRPLIAFSVPMMLTNLLQVSCQFVDSLLFTVPRLPKLAEVKLIFRLGIPAGMQMMVISAGA